MEGETYTGEVSEVQVFFRQIMMISSLSAAVYADTGTGWQTGLRNYCAAVENFESTAFRHLDKEYHYKLNLISARAKMRLEQYRKENPQRSLTNVGKEYETALTYKFANAKLSLVIDALNRRGVFSETQYNALDGGELPIPANNINGIR